MKHNLTYVLYYRRKKNWRENRKNLQPAENPTGLQIEIATSLSTITHFFFAEGRYVYVLKLCTQNFVILDKILWPWQHSKVGNRKISFSAKENKLISAIKTKAFHIGARNLVCTISIHISTHCKKN